MGYDARRQLAALAVGALAIAGAVGPSDADALEIKSSDVHAMDYPTTQAIQHMGEWLSEKTGGELTINIFHSMQLGGEKEALEQVQLGALEMTRVSVGVVGPIVDDFNAFNLPYVFRSIDHMHKVVDGEIGQELLAGLEAGGLIGLGYMDAGARSFYNKDKPISTPDDLKGLKIRVMQNPIFIEMMSAMGGNGIPIAFNELYSALQTGVVDGAENNPPSYSTQKHFEVAGYYSLTEHLIVPEIFVFSKKVWDTLSAEHQNLIREASVLATQKERELWQAMEQKAMGELEGLGVKINADVDKAAFVEATAGVREQFGANYADLLARIDAVQ
ncbi:MAG: TRAP transporter substrate-binding protein [Rhizobiales bacterium]|nr:TRAP transporter substrate-binding protein [Hyphomicrobiales bacterium]